MLGPTWSLPQIAEPALVDDRQQFVDDSIHSRDWEYEDNPGQSEASEEMENRKSNEDEFEQGVDEEVL